MDLVAKAAELGIEVGFFDGQGRKHDIDPVALANLIDAIPKAATGGLLNQPVIVRAGEPAAAELSPGAVLPVQWKILAGETIVAEGVSEQRLVRWPGDLPSGIHQLQLTELSSSHREQVPFIVAPAKAFQGHFERSWILAVQLYGIRSARNWGIGDFSDLIQLIELTASWGGDGVGLNPLHALFPERPADCSPYSPNSRLFLNPLYIDIDNIPEFFDGSSASDPGALARARHSPLVDYVTVAELKWRALRVAFDRFRSTPDAARRVAFDAFRVERGTLLSRFACFEVLRCQFKAPWWQWPEQWQQPDDVSCGKLRAGDSASEIEFVEFVQWVADTQLSECRARAIQLGMKIGLYLDVAVGVQADGFDAWNEQVAISRTLSVGAPPDQLNTAGQNWGLAGFNAAGLEARSFAPFREMLRASMRHAGAVRLDHILGFKRLYLVPHGYSARDGAYVQMPFQSLLAVTALESVAQDCVVIGEDLGTVPERFREEIAEWGIWSYRVMMFERDHHGNFCAGNHYAENALVTFNTHDLATFAGWRSAGDLNLKRSLGLDPGESDDARHYAWHMLADVLRHNAIERDDFFGVLAFLARTGSRLLAISLEDLLGVADQPNIPGTVNEHPNWRRRLDVDVARLAEAFDVAALKNAVGGHRGGAMP
jgi:4-alpha-glucanotransferase